jgi:hypothetical protein
MSAPTGEPLLYEELFALPAEEQARILSEEEEPQPAPVHKAICSWCQPPRVIRDGIEPATHTICAPCEAFYFRGKAKP